MRLDRTARLLTNRPLINAMLEIITKGNLVDQGCGVGFVTPTPEVFDAMQGPLLSAYLRFESQSLGISGLRCQDDVKTLG